MRAHRTYLALATASLVVLGVASATAHAQYPYPGPYYSPYGYWPVNYPQVNSSAYVSYPRPLGSWYPTPFATSGAYPRPLGSWYPTPLGNVPYPKPVGTWYTTPFPVTSSYQPVYPSYPSGYSSYQPTYSSGSYSNGSSYRPNSAPPPPASPPQQPNVVSISDDSFEPAQLIVPVGTTVRWRNNGRHAHTVTSDSGLWRSGKLEPTASYSYTFNKPGTYPYHCTLHEGMRGEVVVE